MKPDQPVRKVQTHLSNKSYKLFQARVAAEQRTPASLVREAVEQYLSQEPARVSPGRSWELSDDE